MRTLKFLSSKLRSGSSKLFSGIALLAIIVAVPPAAADVYMYTDKNGTRWLTNVPVPGKQAKLIARTPGKKTKKSNSSNGLPKGRFSSCLRLNHRQVEKRTAPYLSSIRKYARHFGVEENLVRAIMRQESCFNKKAKSHAGASGLMQLMPGTADMMGVNNIFDPHENIRGGTKYIARMLRRFKGDKQLALAGYNAGPGAVMKYDGIPPYRETQDYVVKVMSEYKRLQKVQRQSNNYIRSSEATLAQN